MIQIWQRIKDFFDPRSIFELERFRFSKLVLERGLLEDIIDFAKANHPKEFIAFLQGKIEDSTMSVLGLIYQKYYSSTYSAFSRINIPVNMNVIGSVHSHPSSSRNPSNQDLRFFSKFGGLHIIIAYPYNKDTISIYDNSGNEIRHDRLF